MPPIPGAVERLFAEADARIGEPDVVIDNASARAPGPLATLDPEAVRRAFEVTAFVVAQAAARRMEKRGHGALLFTGATAGVKGFPLSAAFAMGKFALRGLAQSAARELGPKGIHVAHIVVAGPIRPTGPTAPSRPRAWPAPLSTCCASRGMPGRSRSSCSRGWNGFEGLELAGAAMRDELRPTFSGH